MRPARLSPDRIDASFDERFNDLARLAQRVAFRIVGDREEARDIAQEALVRAYARWPRVEARASGWISRVSTNLAIDHVRRRARPRERPAPDGGDPARGAAERTDLVDALRRLPRRQRDVVVLRWLADLSEAETARDLGCGVGTVKSQGHKGLAALRRHLDVDAPGPPPPPPGARPPLVTPVAATAGGPRSAPPDDAADDLGAR